MTHDSHGVTRVLEARGHLQLHISPSRRRSGRKLWLNLIHHAIQKPGCREAVHSFSKQVLIQVTSLQLGCRAAMHSFPSRR